MKIKLLSGDLHLMLKLLDFGNEELQKAYWDELIYNLSKIYGL
jgi:hypothetical protein